MLYHQDPNERLFLAHQKQRELLEEARSVRRAKPQNGTARVERVRGLRLRLGGILIVIGRTITEEPCPDLAA